MNDMHQETWLDFFLRFWRVSKVKKYINIGNAVCDLGCGYDGYFLKKIENIISSGIGLDLEVCDNYANNKMQFKKEDINRKLSLEDGKFDVVSALAVIEHVDDPPLFLRESIRVLKRGGIMLITTPAPKAKNLWEFLINRSLIRQSEIEEHNHYFRLDELERIVRNAGFSKVKAKTFQFGFNNLIIAQK